MAAAFALANKGINRLEGDDGRRLEQARAEYVERAAQLTDDAATQLNLGKFHFVGGDYPRAAHAFEDEAVPAALVHHSSAVNRCAA